MRIKRLDLSAFGPFTDLSLDLSGPGVHVVYGPNEAGKSSALASLADLLYGFGHSSPYGFLHKQSHLRLGALLEDGTGELEVVRHKRRRDSLTSPGGAPIPEERMAALLHQISREEFTGTFALTLAELQNGGRRLLEGRGDLGQALYSARSGRDLRAVRERLEARQRELFLPTGSNPSLNRLLRRRKELGEELKRAQISAEAFESLHREAEIAAERADELDRKWGEADREHRRWERLARVLPDLRERHVLRERLEALRGQGPLAPADARGRLEELERAREGHRTARDTAASALERDRARAAGVHVDTRLSAVAEEAEALVAELAGVAASIRAWEDGERDEARLREQARQLWARAGSGEMGAEGPERVAAPVRERIVGLIEELPAAEAAAESARGQVRAKEEAAERALADLEALPEPEDSALLQAVLGEAPASLEASLREAREEAGELSARLEAALSEAGWAGRWADADEACAALLAAVVPDASQVAEHRDRLTDLRARTKAKREEHRSALRGLERERGELEALRSRVDPPSEDDLREARLARDTLWKRVRAGEEGLSEEFEAALARADEVADRLRREADAVAERLTRETRVRELEQELAHTAQDLEELETERAGLDRAWEALWPGEDVPAPEVGRADAVLRHLRDLRDLHEERQVARGRAEEAERSARTVADQLGALLTGTDLEPVLVPGADPAVLLPQLRTLAREELERREKAAAERTGARHRRQTHEQDLERLRRDLEAAEAGLREWSRQWDEAVAEAGFDAGARPRSVRADLDLREQAADLWQEACGAGERARAALARVEEFDRELAEVFSACGEDLPEDREERASALRDLHERAKANARAEQDLARLEESAAEHEAELAEARSRSDQVAEGLDALLAEAGAADTAQLRAAIERTEQVADLERQLRTLEQKLAREGDLARLEEEARGLDDAEVDRRVREAELRREELDGERGPARERSARARSEFERVDGSARAAEIAEELAAVGAEIEEQTAEYMRLAFAREILSAQVEDYRQRNQDPVLLRAQELFSFLTLERFTGLSPDTDERGNHLLRVVRRTGQLEEVASLSEGTADQLYLALRLASLERYAEAGRTMPFVVDDVFLAFDDERSEAALRVLGGMADRFQVVVFTHHGHLADLARETLPDRSHVHMLPRFDPPPVAGTA